MNELELIRRLTANLPTNDTVVTGAGDDCAVLDPGIPGRFLLFKTDAVVQGIHFDADARPENIGHKALARGLSDIAAMAGTPTAALVTLALPRGFEPGFIERIYAGLNALAQRHGVAIAGGETTTSPERLLISISLLGTVAKAECVRRSGAKAGDAIFVTGELGGSLAGKHLDFEPRLAEARWLAQHFAIHAMIDLSDGLASDLRHVLEASHVGAELLTSAIPISRAARIRRRRREEADGNGSSAGPPPHVGGYKPPIIAALTDGEDFELLFTVATRTAVPLLDAWKREFPKLKLGCIGKITTAPGLRIRDKAGVMEFTGRGYTHFA